jgi:uncharacterized membrane protein YeaQ/YmgE (transglycosylase-associated protein family)
MLRTQLGSRISLAQSGTFVADTNPQKEDSMLHLIWSVIVGFVVGLIARAILPGADHMGFIMTSLLGIVGSVIGGYIGRLINKPEPGATFHPAGFLMSIVGAVVLLFVLRSL